MQTATSTFTVNELDLNSMQTGMLANKQMLITPFQRVKTMMGITGDDSEAVMVLINPITANPHYNTPPPQSQHYNQHQPTIHYTGPGLISAASVGVVTKDMLTRNKICIVVKEGMVGGYPHTVMPAPLPNAITPGYPEAVAFDNFFREWENVILDDTGASGTGWV